MTENTRELYVCSLLWGIVCALILAAYWLWMMA